MFPCQCYQCYGLCAYVKGMNAMYCEFGWMCKFHLLRALPLQVLQQQRAGPAAQCSSHSAPIAAEQGPSGSGDHGPPSTPQNSTPTSGTGTQGRDDDIGRSFKVNVEEGDIEGHHELLIDVAEDMHHAHGIPCDRKQMRVLLYAEGADVLKVSLKIVHCIVAICWPWSGQEGAAFIPSKCHLSSSLRRVDSCVWSGSSPWSGALRQSSCSLPDATNSSGALFATGHFLQSAYSRVHQHPESEYQICLCNCTFHGGPYHTSCFAWCLVQAAHGCAYISYYNVPWSLAFVQIAMRFLPGNSQEACCLGASSGGHLWLAAQDRPTKLSASAMAVCI